jgi:Phage P22-like portal protein
MRSKEHTDSEHEVLSKLRKSVEGSYIYFKDNCQRFRDFKNYTFRETLTEQQKGMLTSLNRPQLEFNLGAANVARKLGEFAMHEPSIVVTPCEGIPVNDEVIDIVEGNIRHKIHDANKNSFGNEVYKDMLGGGFSAGKVYTDFQSSMSFNQDIIWSKCFDSTMVGFDPLARAPHKGDGNYSFEMYPVIAEELKQQIPSLNLSLKADSTFIESYEWSYKDMYDNIVILVCDFFEKKKKRRKIVKLADGKVMTLKHYEKMQKYWEENQVIEQIPAIISKRTTVIDVIYNYKFVRDQLLESTETDYCYLPHVFFDGNSEILCKGHTNTSYQFTKPYYYHAKGAQDMMNFMGIAITNSTDNLSSSKFIVKEEAIPQQQDYIDAITEPQRANTIVVRAYSENNPDKPIPEPIREVQYPPLPPEVMGTFNQSVQFIQAILGSGSSNPENAHDYISGKAIIEASNADNAAGMPYTIGYLAGLEQMGRIHVDLMPKYLLGKRTIPVVNKSGERIYQDINQAGKPAINYEQGAISVQINAGVNFQVQKDKAMGQIVGLMQAAPKFAEFMNSPQGLPILLSNLVIYGADRLQDAAKEWLQMEEQKQQQAMQAQQQAMQQDPRFIKAQADVQKVQIEGQQLQLKAEQQEFDHQVKIAELSMEQEKVQNEAILVQHEAAQEEVNAAVQREKAQAEIVSHSLDAAAKLASIEHQQKMSEHDSIRKSVELHHKIKGEKDDQ